MPSTQKNVLFFRDLNLSVSEWVPFGQNAISTLNGILDSVRGVRDSLLTGKVDVIKSDNPYLWCRKCDAEEELHFLDIEEVPYVTSPVFPEIWLPK